MKISVVVVIRVGVCTVNVKVNAKGFMCAHVAVLANCEYMLISSCFAFIMHVILSRLINLIVYDFFP